MKLLILRRCHTFSQPLMPTIRGDCGHLKASWDNHTNCLSCSSCSRYSTFLVCKNWSGSIWELADKRKLYCFRCSTMTKTKTSSKKNKNNVNSELSEDIASKDNRITTPNGFTGGGRPHNGGGSKNGQIIHSVSPPVTGHQSPGSQLHQSLSTSHKSLNIEHQAPVKFHWAPVSEYGPSNTGLQEVDFFTSHHSPISRH